MKVRVDTDKCQGHARCFSLVPEFFSVDDWGTSSVQGDGTVPAELESRVKLAVANCPEYAIEVLED
jgi:ferredoxin